MGWLADLLTTVNNPIAKLIPENTMYRDLADHFGAVGTNKWYEAGGDIITGDKPFNWETISEGLQGAGKSTPTGRAVDNFAWKVIGPIISTYYGGPYAGAAASGLGQKLAGESDRDALIAAGSTYAGGKLSQLGSQYSQGASSSKELGSLGIGNPGAYGGSSENITTAARNTGTLAKVLNVAKNALTQGIDKTADANNQQNFGLNKFSYLTGIIGDALNPTSPLRGVGQTLAQQNQFNRATAASQKKKSIASSLIRSILLGETATTKKGEEGLSNFRIEAGRDGKPVMKMEYDLSQDDLASAYKPGENDILTPEMQSTIARQEDQVADSEMSIAQLLAQQKAAAERTKLDERDYKLRERQVDLQAERDKVSKADRESDNKLNKLRYEMAELEKQNMQEYRNQKLKLQAEKDEAARNRQEVQDAFKQRIAESNLAIKQLKAGIDPKTGEKLPTAEQAKQLTAWQARKAQDETTLDMEAMLQGRARKADGKYTIDLNNRHVIDLNDRIVRDVGMATNLFVWKDGKPVMIEFTNGKTAADYYAFIKSKGGTSEDVINSLLTNAEKKTGIRFVDVEEEGMFQ